MDKKRNLVNASVYILLVYLLSISSTMAEGLFGSQVNDEFLPVDEAFKLTYTTPSANEVKLLWNIEPGYYLYRKRINVEGDSSVVTVGSIDLPEVKLEHDEIFGDVQIFENVLEVTVPVNSSSDSFKLDVGYQGCAHAGLCYPPTTKTLDITLPPSNDTAANSVTTSAVTQQSEQSEIASKLGHQSLAVNIGMFFAFGLLLAFTPCVFPMIPILSSIIAGQGETMTASRGFLLSLVYVLAMAVTYTAAGIIVGFTGANIQIWFQDPWVIGSFTVVFVLLALSMFGLYELQMPSFIQSRLNAMSNDQQNGTLVGTAIMGFLSALIVGPCVTAPLIGALIYIAETGDPWIGGTALFSLSIGMGLPLLAIGTSAGKYLPKAGAWMEPIKYVFGVLLLAMAIWFLERVTPMSVVLVLSGLLLIGCAVYLGVFVRSDQAQSGWSKLSQVFAWVALVYGTVLIIAASAGSQHLLKPLTVFTNPSSNNQQEEKLAFQPIKGLAGLEQALNQARNEGKPLMLDFYADWCVSCKELEAFTFSDPRVHQALKDFLLVKADVTDNDAQDQALLKHLGLFGPPAILFYEPNGT
ncbi:MAG: protein-disulfide reductase DsbD, partial [Pseudomonadota bacterium]